MANDNDAPADARIDALAGLAIYQDAFLDKDAEAACARMTGQAKRRIVSELALVAEDGLNCESVVQGAIGVLGPDDFAVLRKSRNSASPKDVAIVRPDAAVIDLASGNQIELRRFSGEWYVSDPDVDGG